MRKFGKGYNLALIFMLVGAVFFPSLTYALRVPNSFQDQKFTNRVKETTADVKREKTGVLTAEEAFARVKRITHSLTLTLELLKMRALKPGEKVLHIGVGGSALPKAELLMGLEVIMVDIDEDLIIGQGAYEFVFPAWIEELPDIKRPTRLCMDAVDLDEEHGFMPDTFEHITLLNLFDDFTGSYGDKEKIIENALVLVREGGTILATTTSIAGSETEALMLRRIAEKKDIGIEEISDDIKIPLYKSLCAIYRVKNKAKGEVNQRFRHKGKAPRRCL